MTDLPKCTKCGSAYTYEDGTLYICPECSHEWPIRTEETDEASESIVRDAHGNILSER